MRRHRFRKVRDMPPEASKMLNQLKNMKTREPEAFTMAMGALQSMGEG